MEQVQWKVEGMDCANCALSIHRYLQKTGAEQIAVNAIDGGVSFMHNGAKTKEQIAKGIHDLGYEVVGDNAEAKTKKPFLSNHLQRFWACLPFTAVLMLHMLPGGHLHFLMNPWIQFFLALPVYIIGMSFFGKSALKSLRSGVPNMNVLIAIGATAAFGYSVAGMLLHLGEDYIFFETAATIITLVFLGNYLEDVSVQTTQHSLRALMQNQKVMANMIAFDGDHQEVIFPVENTALKAGDLVLINTGEQVPADCKILWGEAYVNEALLTGESTPLLKQKKDAIVGGSIIESGSVKAQVTAAGADSVLAGIIDLVKKAQGEKPPVQQMADRISAIFVPVVLSIALLTLLINWAVGHQFVPALLRSIAVLVIACPCAMGLATPAAIAVGLGRGARNGILFRHAKSLELFKNIKQVVFDKTGTLTTGKFKITRFSFTINEEEAKRIIYSLEKHSVHPLAKSIAEQWKVPGEIKWKKIEEVKGQGMMAIDMEGNSYSLGSYKTVAALTDDQSHNIYLMKNNEPIGWLDMEDEIRPEAATVISYLKRKNIKTILLSGDSLKKTKAVADTLGMDEVIAEQTPEQKLQQIESLTAQSPTAMIGDGINDAPALAKATIGISMSDASGLARQSAGVVLTSGGLAKLPMALGLGRHTYLTIKQNLFWAFIYNIIAIPVAALGFLSPMFGALVMGLSDVVLAINSGRLYVKKVV